MKSPDNTEMDRLLRRYARRGGEALRAGLDEDNEANNTVHMDADELNAYAEGALPENARSRYFAHLADCDTCRKLVTDLTLAASLADEGKARVAATDVSHTKSWRDWLASIFSPPVLRYGVPALALFAIIVVAIVATRTQREASFVAQSDKGEKGYVQSATANNSSPEQAATTGTTAENHSNSNVALPTDDQKKAQPDMAATPSPANTGSIEKDVPGVGVIAADKPAPTPTVGSTNEVFRESEGPGKRVEESPSVATAQPPSPAESASTAESTVRDRREAERKAKVAGKDDDEVRVTPNTAGGIASSKSEANESRSDAGREITSRSIQNLPATRKAPAAPKSDAADLAAQKERKEET
ncbi:MAG TPA: zf-HC2 domain-containing protein, partial [Pyrinomonadaceae bacterium]